jgi:hypothetical protein
MCENTLLEPVQEQPRAAHQRVRGHELRVRKAFVDVLVDDVRLVQHEIALDQHRHWLWDSSPPGPGLWSRSTSMIWKSMPFSCSTMRQRWLNGSVVPE